MRLGVKSDAAPSAIARPQVDDGVGRRVMVLASFGLHLFEHLRLDQGAQQRPGQHSFKQRRFMPRGRLQHRLTCAVFEVSGGYELVDESKFQCLVSANVLAGQHHVHRRAYADQPHAAYCAAKTGMNTEQDFRKTQCQFVVVDGHAILAGERELQATA